MNAPTKCEAVRRANINVVDLAELEQLSDSTTLLYKEFDYKQWLWKVVVEHPVLDLVAPGEFAQNYQSVDIFNRMISAKLTEAMSGKCEKTPEERDPYAALLKHHQYLQAIQYQQQQLQRQALQGQQLQSYPTAGQPFGLSLGGSTGTNNTPGSLFGYYDTTSSGSNTP